MLIAKRAKLLCGDWLKMGHIFLNSGAQLFGFVWSVGYLATMHFVAVQGKLAILKLIF